MSDINITELKIGLQIIINEITKVQRELAEETKKSEQFKWALKLKDDFRQNERLRLSDYMLDPKYNHSVLPVPLWANTLDGQCEAGVFQLNPHYILNALAKKNNNNIITVHSFVYSECITELILELEVIGMSLDKNLTTIDSVCDLIICKATPLLPFYDQIVSKGYLQCKFCMDLTYGCHLGAKCDGNDCENRYEKWNKGSRFHCVFTGCDFDFCSNCFYKTDVSEDHKSCFEPDLHVFKEIKIKTREDVTKEEILKQQLILPSTTLLQSTNIEKKT